MKTSFGKKNQVTEVDERKDIIDIFELNKGVKNVFTRFVEKTKTAVQTTTSNTYNNDNGK